MQVIQRLNNEKGEEENSQAELRERIKGLEDDLASTVK